MPAARGPGRARRSGAASPAGRAAASEAAACSRTRAPQGPRARPGCSVERWCARRPSGPRWPGRTRPGTAIRPPSPGSPPSLRRWAASCGPSGTPARVEQFGVVRASPGKRCMVWCARARAVDRRRGSTRRGSNRRGRCSAVRAASRPVRDRGWRGRITGIAPRAGGPVLRGGTACWRCRR